MDTQKLKENFEIKREFGTTPNGNNMNGRWVLRENGKLLDFDQYRYDLMDRNNQIFIKGE